MRKIVLWSIAIALVTGMAYYVITEIDMSVLTELSMTTIFIVSLLTIGFLVAHVAGVQCILNGLGYSLPLKDIFLVMSSGGAATFVGDPKIGIPTRVFLFKTLLKVPVLTGSAAILIETVLWLYLIGLIMMVPLPMVWGGKYVIASLAALSFVGSITAVFLFFPNIQSWFPEAFREGRLKKIQNFINDFIESIAGIKKVALLKAIINFAIGWLINALSLYFILLGFGMGVNLFHLLYISVFAYLVGTFSMLPMGLGARDLSLTYLLTLLGVSEEIAALTALVQRVFRTFLPLLIGVISINILGGKQIFSKKELPE
jgi:uncharacterized protein (TIRG00374 family)